MQLDIWGHFRRTGNGVSRLHDEISDILTIDGQDVLMFSPQGLPAQGDQLQNIHNTGYVLGSLTHSTSSSFEVTSDFEELDQDLNFMPRKPCSMLASFIVGLGWYDAVDQEKRCQPGKLVGRMFVAAT